MDATVAESALMALVKVVPFLLTKVPRRGI
jgi:hypothetical protein